MFLLSVSWFPFSITIIIYNNSIQLLNSTLPLNQPTFKMQFSTAIFALAAAMGASAADVVFKVSDFSASGIPHSGQVS